MDTQTIVYIVVFSCVPVFFICLVLCITCCSSLLGIGKRNRVVARQYGRPIPPYYNPFGWGYPPTNQIGVINVAPYQTNVYPMNPNNLPGANSTSTRVNSNNPQAQSQTQTPANTKGADQPPASRIDNPSVNVNNETKK